MSKMSEYFIGKAEELKGMMNSVPLFPPDPREFDDAMRIVRGLLQRRPPKEHGRDDRKPSIG